jgi:hypothetical protein
MRARMGLRSPTKVAKPTAPAAQVVVWSDSGSGVYSGPKFTIPSSAKGWDEVWSYNCASFGGRGNFITSITGYGSAAGILDSGANQLGAKGSGTNTYYDKGTFSIQVNSECSWTEKVVEIRQSEDNASRPVLVITARLGEPATSCHFESARVSSLASNGTAHASSLDFCTPP